jgi:tetratricopeptide (TPR) repeat protein
MAKLLKEVSQLEELILKGGFKEAFQLIDQVPAERDIRSAATRAQILIYHGRLDESAEVLKSFEDKIRDETNLKDTAEFGLAKGELLYWRAEYEAAEKQAQNVLGIYRLKDDPFGQARALSLLGRVYRRQGSFDLAKKYLTEAQDALDQAPRNEATDFLSGIVLFNLGVARHQLGELDQAEPLYARAKQLLKKTEDGRAYASVLNSYGTLLKAKGRLTEAMQAYQEALRLFSGTAFFDDLAHVTNNLAHTQIRLGHYDEAERLLNESLELRRRAGDIAGESATLELVGLLRLERGQWPEAQSVLASAIEMAELAKNDQEKAFALITLGRVLAAQGALDQSKEKLDEALRLAIQLKSKMLECESCAYLAEVTALRGDGIGAYEYLYHAQELMNGYTDDYLKTQIKRIERLLKEQKIKTQGGVFMIKSSFLPMWREAHEALGRFLLQEALDRSGGSQVRAADILGVTKAYITMLRRKYRI